MEGKHLSRLLHLQIPFSPLNMFFPSRLFKFHAAQANSPSYMCFTSLKVCLVSLVSHRLPMQHLCHLPPHSTATLNFHAPWCNTHTHMHANTFKPYQGRFKLSRQWQKYLCQTIVKIICNYASCPGVCLLLW